MGRLADLRRRDQVYFNDLLNMNLNTLPGDPGKDPSGDGETGVSTGKWNNRRGPLDSPNYTTETGQISRRTTHQETLQTRGLGDLRRTGVRMEGTGSGR